MFNTICKQKKKKLKDLQNRSGPYKRFDNPKEREIGDPRKFDQRNVLHLKILFMIKKKR